MDSTDADDLLSCVPLSPSLWHTCCVRTKLCSPSSLLFTHMQCHSLITRWKQCSAQTGFSACCSESCCFPLKYKANQMATFHHVCSEVLLLFKQIYTVLSGGNTVTVCPYSMWAGFHVSLCLKPLCLLVSWNHTKQFMFIKQMPSFILILFSCTPPITDGLLWVQLSHLR